MNKKQIKRLSASIILVLLFALNFYCIHEHWKYIDGNTDCSGYQYKGKSADLWCNEIFRYLTIGVFSFFGTGIEIFLFYAIVGWAEWVIGRRLL